MTMRSPPFCRHANLEPHCYEGARALVARRAECSFSQILRTASLDATSTMSLPCRCLQMIEGHYTCHTKSVVTKPENVHILENIMCTGYDGGGGTEFITPDSLRNIMAGSLDRANGSLIAIPIRQAPADGFCDLLNIGLPWNEASAGSGERPNTFPQCLDETWHDLYKDLFSGLGMYVDVEAATSQSFVRNGVTLNHACFVGSHRFKRHMNGNQSVAHTVGQGHFGGDALPGDARWRRGESVTQESARRAVHFDVQATIASLTEKAEKGRLAVGLPKRSVPKGGGADVDV